MSNNKFIIVVDDEHQIHELIAQQLIREGYDELSFDAPSEALRYFQKNSSRIDVAIVDLTLPEMNGIELTEKLLAMKPDLPAILITGQTFEPIPPAKERLFHKILHKPFFKEEIIAAVDTAVRREQPTAD